MANTGKGLEDPHIGISREDRRLAEERLYVATVGGLRLLVDVDVDVDVDVVIIDF